MNAEAVELVRRAADAMCRQDLDGFLAAHHPDAEIFPLIVSVEGGGYRGHDEIRRFWLDIHGAFEDWCPQTGEIREVGDAIVLDLRLRGRGKDSGIDIDRRVWQVAGIRAGKLAWWRICTSEQEAVEVAERGQP